MSTLFLLAFLIGAVAGLRVMTAPAAVSWAAHLGWLELSGSPLAFLGWTWTPWVFTVLALVEFVADQSPSTPSRTVPMQFGARLVSGALSGAALGIAAGNPWVGAGLGVVGAAIGTLGGRAGRGALADAFGRDRPAALAEDAVAIVAAVLIMLAVR
jgi:uncharacterized membrane protein